MKYFIAFILFQIGQTAAAQPTPEQRIQDSVIGWWDNNEFDNKLVAGTDPVRKARIAIDDLFVDWMKKTYTPVGGLGTCTRLMGSTYFGTQFLAWNVSHDKQWCDNKGHFRPIPEENTKFGITVNGISGRNAIKFINTSTTFYFTWQPDGYGNNKPSDPRINPNAYPFITSINEVATVYLAPGNKLPFMKVTKGEFLQQAEAAIANLIEDKKKYVASAWPDNPKSQKEALDYYVKEMDTYRENIGKLRIKHAASLNEPAVLRDMQPNIYTFRLDPDPFMIYPSDIASKSYYDVYKITPDVLEKCKSSQPQWISIWLPVCHPENGTKDYEMYRAVTENFNYRYAYDYFFDPEKVKGIPYTPLNADQLKARLDGYRNKYKTIPAAISGAKGPNVIFSDDFSSNAEGASPSGWYFSRIDQHAVVISLPGKTGKWLQPGYGNLVTPSYMPKPLPENFKLEFDIATSAFTSRTGGALVLHLSSYPLQPDGREDMNKPGTTIDLKLIAGNAPDFTSNFGNYMGAANIEMHNSPEIYKENFSEGLFFKFAQGDFTNRKDKAHITVIFQNNNFSVMIDQRTVFTSNKFTTAYNKPCSPCDMPAGVRFNTLNFKNTTNDAEHTRVYLTNVTITKN